MAMAHVFVSGATGYLASRLIPALLDRGHKVRGLARPGRESILDARCEVVPGEALLASSFASRLAGCDTLVHLVGTPKPAPWKERQFRSVDLASLFASAEAALRAGGIQHFVYVSVAQPAPVMRAYQQVRAEAEAHLAMCGFDCTILRPWYVLGPGHWWPLALLPIYAVAEQLAWTRESAIRLGLVRVEEMVRALVRAVENPPCGRRVVETREIRAQR